MSYVKNFCEKDQYMLIDPLGVDTWCVKINQDVLSRYEGILATRRSVAPFQAPPSILYIVCHVYTYI